MLRQAVAAAALLLLAAVLQDAFEVMLLPRRVHRQLRLSGYFFAATWFGWTALARRLPAGPRRERLLSVFGALSMVVLFALWAAALITGFGALFWAFEAVSAHALLWEQVYMSGVTFFTLGYGDVVPHNGLGRALAVAEAGTGIGFIAVVIGYLPVLYQLFSRREAHVIQLDARAGSPPAAATLLLRHAEAPEKLDEFLREWEVWGSELLESHLSYPMLVYYRSQHDNQSWLAALAVLMDACALILVAVESVPSLQARMTFTMSRQVLVEMARSLRVAPSRYQGVDRLRREDFVVLAATVTEAGLACRGDDETGELLAALRSTYEPLLDGLANALLLAVPPWLPETDAADNWGRGHRGLIARRLIEQLAERGPGATASGSGRFAQRLRRRLRGEPPGGG